MTDQKTDADLLAKELSLMKKGAGIPYLYIGPDILARDFVRFLREKGLTIEKFARMKESKATRIAEEFMTKDAGENHTLPTANLVAAAGIVAARKNHPEMLIIMKRPGKPRKNEPTPRRPFSKQEKEKSGSAMHRNAFSSRQKL